MSEFNGKHNERVESIYRYTLDLINEGGKKEYYERYKDILKTVTPLDTVVAFDKVVKDGYDMEDIKSAVSKVLNIIYEPLVSFKKPEYSPMSILYYLEKDNEELEKRLKNAKEIVKRLNENPQDDEIKKQMKEVLQELVNFEKHYVIKENILFPIIEKNFSEYRCLQIMWAIHDDVRGYFKELNKLLSKESFDIETFNKLIGKLYFDMFTLIFRENKILYPVAAMYIPDRLFDECLNEALEIGFPFVKIENGNLTESCESDDFGGGVVNLGTGVLTAKQIKLIFDHLPVDITFVDENDTIKYFSSPKDRIFVRTKSVIGRKVQNCHPHDSVHVVNEIISAFKNGERDMAKFWIKMGDKYVLIQYFAIRDENGDYKGLIEVSQDIADIKKIEGEKRLLDWS
ncbi:DUF438 domain-containing protein [Deferribacter autotrophicus]|uniref:DUF438 domain-containing protein n=1 Tax=Deferribacter autotrophicus TaxID=500465 RepID=A0A5A8F0E9_9BACT|nr:PAS domain-containing protein [Deferribacter autotrophicus]KAA0257328.1 DUF438 domain-containing protein [Deferribacter autotrophicus]